MRGKHTIPVTIREDLLSRVRKFLEQNKWMIHRLAFSSAKHNTNNKSKGRLYRSSCSIFDYPTQVISFIERFCLILKAFSLLSRRRVSVRIVSLVDLLLDVGLWPIRQPSTLGKLWTFRIVDRFFWGSFTFSTGISACPGCRTCELIRCFHLSWTKHGGLIKSIDWNPGVPLQSEPFLLSP